MTLHVARQEVEEPPPLFVVLEAVDVQAEQARVGCLGRAMAGRAAVLAGPPSSSCGTETAALIVVSRVSGTGMKLTW